VWGDIDQASGGDLMASAVAAFTRAGAREGLLRHF
jgi:hypothetical protein